MKKRIEKCPKCRGQIIWKEPNKGICLECKTSIFHIPAAEKEKNKISVLEIKQDNKSPVFRIPAAEKEKNKVFALEIRQEKKNKTGLPSKSTQIPINEEKSDCIIDDLFFKGKNPAFHAQELNKCGNNTKLSEYLRNSSKLNDINFFNQIFLKPETVTLFIRM